MTKQEAQADPAVVTGLISIYSVDAFILIDSNSTHSYISVDFVQYINKEADWLDSQMIITTPVGGPFIAEYVYKDCEILVESRVLAANLIPLPLKKFDAILGMD